MEGARIHESAVVPKSCRLGPGAVIMEKARLGENVSLGAYSIVYPGVIIGDGTQVQDHSVVGRPTITSRASTRQADEREPLVIGRDCIIGCSVVLYWGTTLADGVMIADMAFVREGCRIGRSSIIGHRVTVEYNTVIGERVKIQTGAYVTGNMLVEDDVFIGPRVATANDLKMDRVKGEPFAGPIFRRGARIGSNSTILPGGEIGRDAVVAAGAVVRKNVPPLAIVAGNPARVCGRVPEWQQLDRKQEGTARA